ncbi:MAG: efflux RND transporter periplasmic adaptor subunit, partial [Hyphomicrobiaceae bacterium]
AVFASTLVIAGGLASCGETDHGAKTEGAIRPVKIFVVKEASTKLRRAYPAIVLPSKEAKLSFRVSGNIISLPIRASQKVKKGDVIAQLDQRDFQSEVSRLGSQLEQAKAQLKQMKAGARSQDIASLRAQVDAAKAEVAAAGQQLQRTETLFRKDIVSKARLDQDQLALNVAEARLKASEQELEKGRAGSRTEEIAAQQAVINGFETQLQSARDALSDTTLKAPFTGIVSKREVDNFANVQSQEVIAVLQDLGTIDLTYDVPGPDVTVLSRGRSLKAVAKLDAIPDQTFAAKFVEFTTQAETTTQTFRARASISQPEGAVILPGMTGRIVVTGPSDGAGSIAIPASAIGAEADGQPFVWIVTKPDNKVSKRLVKTGEAKSSMIIVTDGMNPGDVIVTAGVSFLRENMVVRPISKVGE